MRRPTKRQIERVTNWLNSIGVEMYGANMTPDGLEWLGCMDYDVDAALNRHDHIRRGTLVSPGDNPVLREELARPQGRPKGAKDKKPRKRRST